MIHYINFLVFTEKSIWQLVNCAKGLLGVNFFCPSFKGSSHTVFFEYWYFYWCYNSPIFLILWRGLRKIKPEVLLVRSMFWKEWELIVTFGITFLISRLKIMSKYNVRQLNHRGKHQKANSISEKNIKTRIYRNYT